MDKSLRYSSYAGMLFILLSIVGSVSAILLPTNNYIDSFLSSAGLFSLVVFFWGIKVLGGRINNRLLQYTALILILSLVPLDILRTNVIKLAVEMETYLLASLFLIMGITTIVAGIGFMKTKSRYGNKSTIAALTSIFYGICAMVVVLLRLAFPDGIPININTSLLTMLSYLSIGTYLISIIAQTSILYQESKKPSGK